MKSVAVGTRFLALSTGGRDTLIILVGGRLPGGDEPKGDEAARERLKFMKGRMDGLMFTCEKSPDKSLTREKEPVVRYANPARGVNADGAVFVWHEGGRPAAAAAMRVRPDGVVRREFVSLTDQGLRCERDGKVVRSPKPGGPVKKPLPDAPAPAATRALRLAQLRRQVERFSAEFDHLSAGKWEDLRLMPQPVYRYTADKGSTEGAVFALAQANDPELLVVLEISGVGKPGPKTWTYALARMSSQPMRARLDKKEVWSVGGYWSSPRSVEDPYQEAADGRFPDPVGPAPKMK